MGGEGEEKKVGSSSTLDLPLVLLQKTLYFLLFTAVTVVESAWDMSNLPLTGRLAFYLDSDRGERVPEWLLMKQPNRQGQGSPANHHRNIMKHQRASKAVPWINFELGVLQSPAWDAGFSPHPLALPLSHSALIFRQQQQQQQCTRYAASAWLQST